MKTELKGKMILGYQRKMWSLKSSFPTPDNVSCNGMWILCSNPKKISNASMLFVTYKHVHLFFFHYLGNEIFWNELLLFILVSQHSLRNTATYLSFLHLSLMRPLLINLKDGFLFVYLFWRSDLPITSDLRVGRLSKDGDTPERTPVNVTTYSLLSWLTNI